MTQEKAVVERQRDAERTRTELLDVATEEFAENGYSGARVDEIAARTRTTKRMIYYYFGGKEQLYLAVLERAYAEIRAAERTVDVDHLDPVAAVRRLAEVTFDHHEAHPAFIKLVGVENAQHAKHMNHVARLVDLNSSAVDLLRGVLDRGRAEGTFRDDVDALDVHMMISSFCFFRVANRHTWGALFDRDLLDESRRGHYRTMLGDLVTGYLRK
ncbi:AcrR family transcriptional regulator [Actinoplanes campanulatus]|uniref:AcrR family transcriptional regulator n=1 Tax=Actinoplanes campanulatus TaxID=113559 RepID=A0A7W5AAU3_9ACTN|nr:TetR/AcrR family transcriptional regulator [Actinoplanes campanulatus]MBB3092811.1 AcrR family transcriptional regulator [Actinoplanes campanulatus]GGM99187.1 TetR family transcriptional regulator [Actinoplanes campanulatus]